MRQIIFRARTLDGTWTVGTLHALPENIDCSTLGQLAFKGTEDTPEIWEGDVIEATVKNSKGEMVKVATSVQWYDELAGFGVKDYEQEEYFSPDHLNRWKVDYLFNECNGRVVGTVYDSI